MWPLSREQHPKQLLKLLGERTLLQNTLLRVNDMPDMTSPLIVCNEAYRFQVLQQIRDAGIDDPTLILEPQARSTAPAIALAAFHTSQNRDDPILVVMPSDHVIVDVSSFQAVLLRAADEADKGKIVTFGVPPERSDTGYGYIVAKRSAYGVHIIEKFVEKPPEEVAKALMDSSFAFWNSGIFVFKASVYIEALRQHCPAVHDACRSAMTGATRDKHFIRPQEKAFLSSPSISVDYAVMEKAEGAVVIPLESGWSDIGTWQRLWSVSGKDANGNVQIGDVLCENTHNSYLHGTSRCIAAVGLDNIIVVETPDAVLVSNQSQGHDAQKIFSRLKEAGRSETLLHKLVYRPWGSYECLEQGPGFKVKRIRVLPGAKLSLQKHQKRSEHWVVINGVATITRGDEMFKLQSNESTFIPLGVLHRIANNTDDDLEIIEVQTGSYLEEDDIIRFDDIYGRDVA